MVLDIPLRVTRYTDRCNAERSSYRSVTLGRPNFFCDMYMHMLVKKCLMDEQHIAELLLALLVALFAGTKGVTRLRRHIAERSLAPQ